MTCVDASATVGGGVAAVQRVLEFLCLQDWPFTRSLLFPLSLAAFQLPVVPQHEAEAFRPRSHGNETLEPCDDNA